MPQIGIVCLTLLVAFAEPAVARSAPPTDASRAAIALQTQSFGEVYQFGSVEARFRVDNESDGVLEVQRVETLGESGSVDPSSAVIAPRGHAEFHFRQAVGNRLGQTAFRARLVFADGSDRKLVLSGFLQSAYDPERVVLDFGRLAREEGGGKAVTVGTREGANLEILGLADGSPAWLEWRARSGSRASGSLIVKANAPLGHREIGFGLATNLTHQPRIDGKLVMEVVGDWVPDRSRFDLASIEQGKVAVAAIELRSRSGRQARFGLLESSNSHVEVSATPCAVTTTGMADCWRITATVVASETGLISGRVIVAEDAASESLEFPFGALVVQPNKAIKKIRVPGSVESFSDLLRPEEDGGDPLGPPVPFLERPVAVAGTPAEPTRQRRVTVRWRARNDEGVYGYLVYRAAAPEGPFLRLNTDIVRPSRLEFEHAYSFEDRGVERGRTYWYYVDVVSTGGRKYPFSPVLSRSIAADAAD